jgi:gamma-tubulin complex component 2
MLFEEEHLGERLESIKNYFFMEKGDLFSHFLEVGEEILELPCSKISKEKITSLFEMCVRTSSANEDKFKDDIIIEINEYSLKEQLYALQNIKGAFGNEAYTSKKLDINHQNYTQEQQNQIRTGIQGFALDYKVLY